jgi:multiple sugar transport system permease protein
MARALPGGRPAGKRPGRRLGRLAASALLVLGAVVTVVPFYFMFVFATHSTAEIFSLPPPLWFGDEFAANYRILLERVNFWRSVWNSAYLTVVGTVCTLFFCSLAGYAFALYEFRHRERLFGMVLAVLLIPTTLNLIPGYLVMTQLGWVNEPRAVWFPGIASALGIFMMRQYIASAIPRDLPDAARIDGASEFGIYWRMILPLSRPALGTLALVTFIGYWNVFEGALVLLRTQETATVQLALSGLRAAGGSTEWGAIMAGTAITVIPLLVLFAFTSRQLISGLTAGSTKG